MYIIPKSAIGGKEPLNRALKPGEYVGSVEAIVSSLHFNLLRRPVDVDFAGFGFHQPDQAGSGGEVLGDFDVDVGEAVRRRDHFDGEIGGERPSRSSCGPEHGGRLIPPTASAFAGPGDELWASAEGTGSTSATPPQGGSNRIVKRARVFPDACLVASEQSEAAV